MNPATAHPGTAGTGIAGSRLGPWLVFLLICVVYSSWPSSHFNADALHYNLHAFISSREPARLLADSSVPAHFSWHLMATLVLMALRPESPEQSLYILRLVNILLALGSILLFMRIVRSYAGEAVAAWAMLVLAFSHACLRQYLTVEVYALNNLVLAALFLAVHAAARGGPERRVCARQALCLAALTAAALSTHVTNLLVVPPILLFLSRGGARGAGRRILVYLAGLLLILLAGLACLLMVGGRDPGGLAAFLFSYRIDTGAYLGGGIGSRLLGAPAALAGAFVGRHPLWLWLPAGLLLLAAAGRRDRIKGDPWISFLLAYTALVGLFAAVWDPANLEHKAALVPPLLLLLTAAYARLGGVSGWPARVGFCTLALWVAGIGLVDDILSRAEIRDFAPYRISAEIHSKSDAPRLVVVADEAAVQDQSVELASMTFFGQQVAIVGRSDPLLAEKVRQREAAGFEVVRLAPTPAPRKAGAIP